MTIRIFYSFLMNTSVLASGFLLSRIFPFSSRIYDRVLSLFVYSASLIVISCQLKSLSGTLSFENLFLFHLFILAFIFSMYLLFARKRSSGLYNKSNAVDYGSLFSPPVITAGLLFLCMGAFVMVMPPAPTDAFLDHLVFPAEWLHAHSITLVPTLSPDQATTYYPANGELMYLWLMLPLHDDLLAGLLEPLCLLVSAAAAFGIARELGVGRRIAASAAATACIVPVVISQTHQFGIDLFFTASFLCSARFILMLNGEKRERLSAVIGAGLAIGLAMGAKYLGVIFAVLLLPAILSSRTSYFAKATNLFLFTLASAATGSYWYVRNLIVTGSPFYPLGVNLLGLPVFKGAYTRSAMLNSYLHTPVGDIASLGSIVTSNIFSVFLIIALAFTLIACMRKYGDLAGLAATAFLCLCTMLSLLLIRKNIFTAGFVRPALVLLFLLTIVFMTNRLSRGLEWSSRLVLLYAPVIFAIFWFVNPYNIANNARFTAPGVFFLFILSAFITDKAGYPWCWSIIAAGAIAGNASNLMRLHHFAADSFTPEAFSSGDARPVLLTIYLLFFLSCLFLFFCVSKRNWKISPLFLFAVIILLWFGISIKSSYMDANRYAWYSGHYLAPGWKVIARFKDPLNIAYTGNCSPYGLYGNKLKNGVGYVNIDGGSGLFHEYVRRMPAGKRALLLNDSTDLNRV
ncbi:MAG TPA: hypothetical protein PLQ76_00645, partial [bacterium]|nr:hypothetical protein [bacterium]